MKKALCKFIFSKLMGWKIIGEFDENIKKCVFIVVSHTSWHDFYIGVFTRCLLGIEINFVGKKELFMFPFGYYFKWMGGEPLDRTGGLNKVDAIANMFEKKEIFRISIAPEGTRKKVTEWRSGFYYISLKAKVPIVPISFDYSKREVIIHKPFSPTGDFDRDYKVLEQNFKGIVGKVPEYTYVVKE